MDIVEAVAFANDPASDAPLTMRGDNLAAVLEALRRH